MTRRLFAGTINEFALPPPSGLPLLSAKNDTSLWNGSTPGFITSFTGMVWPAPNVLVTNVAIGPAPPPALLDRVESSMRFAQMSSAQTSDRAVLRSLFMLSPYKRLQHS